MDDAVETPETIESADAASSPDLTALRYLLRAEDYQVSDPLPGVLHVTGRFSNPERIALAAAAEVGDGPVAIWATSHHDDWTLVCWERPDLVTITQKGAAPQRWRHRQLPTTMRPDAQTFLEGQSSSFDIVTRPKHQPTDGAREVMARFAITDAPPPGWVAPVAPEPVVVRESALPTATDKPARAPRATRAKAPAKPKAPAKTEPVINICPNCFMAIPSTGICDNCG